MVDVCENSDELGMFIQTDGIIFCMPFLLASQYD